MRPTAPDRLHVVGSFVAAAALAVLVLGAYEPALGGGILWDDAAWTTSGRQAVGPLAALARAWLAPSSLQQYYPLTATSFLVDGWLWGDATWPSHLENVALHLASAWLLFRLLRALALPGAGLAAAVFAAHPIMAESVAWLTERKNVLALVLALGAAHRYLSWSGLYAASGEARDERGSRGAYLGALALFVLAMLAKVTVCVLPAILCVVWWWKRGELRARRDLAPLAPFVAIGAAFAGYVWWLEQYQVGAASDAWEYTPLERVIAGGRALWFYLRLLAWPSGQAFVYPRWTIDASSAAAWAAPATALAVPIALWASRRRIGRGPLAAALIFGFALAPVLGVARVYAMRFSFVADRWAYVASIAPIALFAASVTALARRAAAGAAVPFVGAVLVSGLGLLTRAQAAHFRSNEALWRAALAANPDAWLAENNLGVELLRRGETEEAMAHLQHALALRPGYAEVETSIGAIHAEQGRADEAIASYEAAIRHDPKSGTASFALADLLEAMGRSDDADALLRRRATEYPQDAEAHDRLGTVLASRSDDEAAETELRWAVRLRPDLAGAQGHLGQLLMKQGKLAEAIAPLRTASALRPDVAVLHRWLADALLRTGARVEALGEYDAAVARAPDDVDALINLAWILATDPDEHLRDGARAVAAAEHADEVTQSESPIALHILAAAYARAGRFPEAVRTAETGAERATAVGNVALAADLAAAGARYRAGTATVDPRATTAPSDAVSPPPR